MLTRSFFRSLGENSNLGCYSQVIVDAITITILLFRSQDGVELAMSVLVARVLKHYAICHVWKNGRGLAAECTI